MTEKTSRKKIGPIETVRLMLREVSLTDAPQILAMFNQEDCKAYIGDKGLKDEFDARKYIEDGPRKSYQVNGFGLLSVCLKTEQSSEKSKVSDGEFVGLCGLLKRDEFDAPDLGFAFLTEHQRFGYGRESAKAILAYYQEKSLLLGLTHPDNRGSINLLEELGFGFVKTIICEGHQQPTNYFELCR